MVLILEQSFDQSSSTPITPMSLLEGNTKSRSCRSAGLPQSRERWIAGRIQIPQMLIRYTHRSMRPKSSSTGKNAAAVRQGAKCRSDSTWKTFCLRPKSLNLYLGLAGGSATKSVRI